MPGVDGGGGGGGGFGVTGGFVTAVKNLIKNNIR